MKSLKKLLPYIKPYTLFAILGPLLMCIEVSMDLLQPMIMQHIIDDGVANNDSAYVIKLGLLMLVTAIIGLIGGAGVPFTVQRQPSILRRIYDEMYLKRRNNFQVKTRILSELEN